MAAGHGCKDTQGEGTYLETIVEVRCAALSHSGAGKVNLSKHMCLIHMSLLLSTCIIGLIYVIAGLVDVTPGLVEVTV